MSWLRRRKGRLALVVVPLLALVGVGFIPVSVPLSDATVIASSEKNEPVGGIYRDNDAAQQFPANGTAITSVSLFLATYRRDNPGSFRITVEARRGGEWAVLRSHENTKAALRDNSFYAVRFSPPIAVEPGQTLRVRLQADGDAGASISWYVNPQWDSPSYELRRNEQPRAGGGVLTVAYAQQSGPLFGVLGAAWGRATPLLAPAWQVVLALALLAAAATFLALNAGITGRDE